MENEINLKSENLLDDYKARENKIAELQFKNLEHKAKLEMSEDYQSIKSNDLEIMKLKKENEEYKEVVKEKMYDNGLKILETFTHRITLKGTVGSLKIQDEGLVPQEYIKEVKPIFDNAKIKSDIKNGKEIAGCELVEGRSLVITEK